MSSLFSDKCGIRYLEPVRLRRRFDELESREPTAITPPVGDARILVTFDLLRFGRAPKTLDPSEAGVDDSRIGDFFVKSVQFSPVVNTAFLPKVIVPRVSGVTRRSLVPKGDICRA